MGRSRRAERLQGPLSSLLAKYCGGPAQVEYSNSTANRLTDILLEIQYQLQDMKNAQAARQVCAKLCARPVALLKQASPTKCNFWGRPLQIKKMYAMFQTGRGAASYVGQQGGDRQIASEV